MHPISAIRALSLGLSLALAGPSLATPWSAALEAAWRLDPEARRLEAGAELDTARRAEAERFLAEAPELEAQQWRGQEGRGGVEETELDLSLALRWPGERRAAMSLAEAEALERAARRDARRLELAGELRETAAEAQEARAEEALANRRRALVEALGADMDQQVQAGEKAETERLLAQSEILATRRAAQEAVTRRRKADSAWQILVGAELPLPEGPESEAPASEAARHPAWLALAAGRQRLLAEREAAEAEGWQAPRLSLSARRERAEDNAAADTALGLGFSIPLGSRPERGSRRAALTQDLVAVEAELARLAERLQAERLTAEGERDAARASAQLAGEQSALAARQRSEARRALDLGESSLLDYLRLDQLAAEAERAAVLTRIAEARAIARLNQAYGVLP